MHWRDALEPGWVSTDDGCVVQAVKVTGIVEVRGRHIRTRRRVSFYIGTRFAHGRSVYNFLDVIRKNSYGLSEMWWWEKVAKLEPGIITTFAMLVIGKQFNLNVHRYNAAQYALLRQMSVKFFGHENKWRALRTFFNHDEVRKMIQKKIQEALAARNIDIEHVFGLLKSAESMALTQVDKMGNIGNPTAVLAVADRYAGLIGMTGKQTQGQLGAGQQQGMDQLPGASDTYDKILEEETVPNKEKV